MDKLQFFDPSDDYSVIDRHLPHWLQAGTIAFLTFRTLDSMPESVMKRWFAERQALLVKHGIDPQSNWRSIVNALPVAQRFRIKWALTESWDSFLDECHGTCQLRDPAISKIVYESLLHFDDVRYAMTDFVIMPNHVHLLAAFASEEGMLEQCTSWKRYTAVRINRALRQSGDFWQVDGFDHLVRSEEHFQHYRQYIANNPEKCNLSGNEFRVYSKCNPTV